MRVSKLIVLVCMMLMVGSISNAAASPGSLGNAAFPGAPVPIGDVVYGDWTGDGTVKIGIYSKGTWYLDMIGNGVWDGGVVDKVIPSFGVGVPDAIPVTGDWDGSGKTKIGIFSNGIWYLDMKGDGKWDGGIVDKIIPNFGVGLSNAMPVTGDWDNSGVTKIGVYSNGTWYLDMDGNGKWESADTAITGSLGLDSLYLLRRSGPTGPAGSQGSRGLTGPAGATGVAGPAGSQGSQGLQGLTGPAGAAGAAGSAGLQGLQGLQGLTGPAGSTGAAGSAGLQGDKGDTGAPGLAWKGNWNVSTAFVTGDAVVYNSASYVNLVANTGTTPDSDPVTWQLLAAAGLQGATGPAGPQGLQGLTGPAGSAGLTGPAGSTGEAGSTGAAGSAGLQGDKGDPGVSNIVTLTENFNMTAGDVGMGKVFKKAVDINITGVSCLALGVNITAVDIDVQKCDSNGLNCTTILSAPLHCTNQQNVTGVLISGAVTANNYVVVLSSNPVSLTLLGVNIDYQ
jgi:hypothetical protein